MTISSDDFNAALDCWRESTRPSVEKLFDGHWLCGEVIVVAYARQQTGGLSEDELNAVSQVIRNLAVARTIIDRHPADSSSLDETLGTKLDRQLVSQAGDYLGQSWEKGKQHIRQLITVTRALLHGIVAADCLRGWNAEARQPLPGDAVISLQGCLTDYHAAWDLYSRPVDGIASHAAAGVSADQATAVLDEFQKTLTNGSPPEWWTQSNWLLVRRLLAHLLPKTNQPGKDDDTPVVGPTNEVRMLLVTEFVNEHGQTDFQGVTAPVTTSKRREGWPAAYLDPVALGVTVLDDDMLGSLRIAARICRRPLEKLDSQETALRIAPQPGLKGFALLKGESAGGMITLAACATCATAQGHRLNRDCTASFAIAVNQPDLLENVEHTLSFSDVRFQSVDAASIEAKLVTNEDLKSHGIKTVFVVDKQKSDRLNENEPFSEWVPRVEREAGIRIEPIVSLPGPNQT